MGRVDSCRAKITTFPSTQFYPNCDTVGEALISTSTIKLMTNSPAGFVDESPTYLGAAFVTTLSLAGNNLANGKTVAHEIAHVILNSNDNPDGTEVNLLNGNEQPVESETVKRFNNAQIEVIRSSSNQFTAPAN